MESPLCVAPFPHARLPSAGARTDQFLALSGRVLGRLLRRWLSGRTDPRRGSRPSAGATSIDTGPHRARRPGGRRGDVRVARSPTGPPPWSRRGLRGVLRCSLRQVVEVEQTTKGLKIVKVWVALDVGKVVDPGELRQSSQGRRRVGIGPCDELRDHLCRRPRPAAQFPRVPGNGLVPVPGKTWCEDWSAAARARRRRATGSSGRTGLGQCDLRGDGHSPAGDAVQQARRLRMTCRDVAGCRAESGPDLHHAELRTAQISPGELRVLQACVGQIAIDQHRIAEVAARQIRAHQVEPLHRLLAKGDAAQIRAHQQRMLETADELGAAQVHAVQILAVEDAVLEAMEHRSSRSSSSSCARLRSSSDVVRNEAGETGDITERGGRAGRHSSRRARPPRECPHAFARAFMRAACMMRSSMTSMDAFIRHIQADIVIHPSSTANRCTRRNDAPMSSRQEQHAVIRMGSRSIRAGGSPGLGGTFGEHERPCWLTLSPCCDRSPRSRCSSCSRSATRSGRSASVRSSSAASAAP
ncbi:hypothetical protein Ddc_24040 [Ditylenchus destructor]|nr:hypothetical protein Ddc_24040 [Ditylenchus destructor]